jgi:hypothetical protein
MSNYTPKPNNGSLWPNDKKTEEKHPDRTGSIMLECPACQAQWEAFLDGWLKESDAGKKWLSVRVKAKTKKPEGQQAPKTQATTTDF